jgi:two-component sensor histidine kinase
MINNAGIHVLFIDDDEALGHLVKKDLERHGFSAELALDGASGLNRIAAGGIDAVVLDHHLPDGEGLGILGEIQKMRDPPPVTYLTGAQDSKTAIAALKAGACEYLIKDVHGEFLAMLRVDIQSGIKSVRLRRAKEAAEAETVAARDRYKALAQEREVLLREVSHRVSNSLQLIASLLQFQARGATAEISGALLQAHSRVLAVAKVHRSLYTSPNVQSVSLHRYIQALTDDMESASGYDSVGDSFTLVADPIEIGPDRAVAVGVILTELVLNARKHAYPSGKGQIRIKLQAVEPNRSVLSVEDDGIGVANGHAVEASGLGSIIIKAMAQKLGADVSYDPSHKGTRAVISFDPTSADHGAPTGE